MSDHNHSTTMSEYHARACLYYDKILEHIQWNNLSYSKSKSLLLQVHLQLQGLTASTQFACVGLCEV